MREDGSMLDDAWQVIGPVRWGLLHRTLREWSDDAYKEWPVEQTYHICTRDGFESGIWIYSYS